MKPMSDKVPLTAERKAEIYAKIEAGEYGTKETAEPGCKKIFDLDTSNPVGFICVKCGRIFSECSGGYRYQHIRMCNGTKESSLNIRKKKSLKPTPPRPIPILPVTLSNSVRDPSQSTSSNFSSVFISNGFNEEKSSGLHASTWINALSSRQEKEKFVADLSKLLLDHLPLRLAVESINAFEKVLQSPRVQNSESEDYNSRPHNSELGNLSSRSHDSESREYSSRLQNPEPDYLSRIQDPESTDYNSPSTTPVSQLKSEVMGDYPEDFSHDQNSAILSINR